MREITDIIVHCAATKPSQDIGAKEIREWHTKGNGWNDIGYHFVIRRDGTIEKGRPISIAGAHTQGFNAKSIGVCYVGGIDENGKPQDNRTDEQVESLSSLLTFLAFRFNAKISGHNNYTNAKACPSFDARDEYAYINAMLVEMDGMIKQ